MQCKKWFWFLRTWRGILLVTVQIFSTSSPAEEYQRPLGSRSHTLVILHTNDIHGHLAAWRGWEGELANHTVGGLDRLAARVDEIRHEAGAQRVLLLDAGDTLGDTLIAAETEGRAIMKTMNAMRYDAMVVGNHEPDFTAAKLRARIGEAQFPVLAANIVDHDGKLFTQAYAMCDVDGVRVGILGIAYPNTPLTSAHKNVEGLRFLPAKETANQYVPRLKQEGAQIVIALTHLGLSADKELARQVPGIDVIVGGHSHNRMKQALRVGDTLIVQAGAHGSDLGRLDLEIEKGRVVSHRHRLLPITDASADAEVARLIETQSAPYQQKLQERIGRARNLIVRPQTLAGQEPQKRDAESPADQLFADAIRAETGQEIAFLPGVGYGVALQAGDISADALRNLIPHDSTIWTMKLSGADIAEVLEQSIENFMTEDVTQKVGGMIQVSGLRFSYNPNEPQGRRVRSIMVNGKPIVMSRRYGVAVNGLLAQGGHRYAAFTRGQERREAGEEYAMVSAWIKRQGEISSPADQRVTKLAEAKN